MSTIDKTRLGFVKLKGVKANGSLIEVHYLINANNPVVTPTDLAALKLELSLVEAFAKAWVAGTTSVPKTDPPPYPAYTPTVADKDVEMIIITGPYDATTHSWTSGWVVPKAQRDATDQDKFLQKYQFHAQTNASGVYKDYTVNVRAGSGSKNSNPTAAKLAAGRAVVLGTGTFQNGNFV